MTNNTTTPVTAIDDPCQFLPQLRGALYQLMAGQQKAQVRYGDQWVTWHRANVAALQSEVRRLEYICGNRHTPRAVRVGNY